MRLDGTIVWPIPDLGLPPSVLRTVRPRDAAATQPIHVLFGSCRVAAPHEPPWTLQLAMDERGRGVDAYHAHAMRMADQPVERWPDLMVWLGDQVYADDSSPVARERIAERRATTPAHERLPPELVDGFEEFTWLYHESWSSPWERWLLSVVPSVMIFDDHDMIDDWNISDTWVADIRREDWWSDHVVGGLMTYWLYQHLGNLSPDDIDEEGILAALLAADDGEAILRDWAMQSEQFTPVPGGYRFSVARDLGAVKVVVIDSRNGRVLEPGARAIVDDTEWGWIVDQCNVEVDHLLIGSSLPVFVPGAMHDAQRWSEAVIDGAWGHWPGVQQRWVERLRRAIDMEDWPAFSRSFESLVEMIGALASGRDLPAPASISVLSGDIHFSYHARIHYPVAAGLTAPVHQLVNSPIRNALTPPEKLGMRIAMSPGAALAARALRRSTGLRRTPLRWRMDHGPVWDNCIGKLMFLGRDASVSVERASADADGNPVLEVAFVADLTGSATPPRVVSRPQAAGTALAGRIHASIDRIARRRRSGGSATSR